MTTRSAGACFCTREGAHSWQDACGCDSCLKGEFLEGVLGRHQAERERQTAEFLKLLRPFTRCAPVSESGAVRRKGGWRGAGGERFHPAGLPNQKPAGLFGSTEYTLSSLTPESASGETEEPCDKLRCKTGTRVVRRSDFRRSSPAVVGGLPMTTVPTGPDVHGLGSLGDGVWLNQWPLSPFPGAGGFAALFGGLSLPYNESPQTWIYFRPGDPEQLGFFNPFDQLRPAQISDSSISFFACSVLRPYATYVVRRRGSRVRYRFFVGLLHAPIVFADPWPVWGTSATKRGDIFSPEYDANETNYLQEFGHLAALTYGNFKLTVREGVPYERDCLGSSHAVTHTGLVPYNDDSLYVDASLCTECGEWGERADDALAARYSGRSRSVGSFLGMMRSRWIEVDDAGVGLHDASLVSAAFYLLFGERVCLSFSGILPGNAEHTPEAQVTVEHVTELDRWSSISANDWIGAISSVVTGASDLYRVRALWPFMEDRAYVSAWAAFYEGTGPVPQVGYGIEAE